MELSLFNGMTSKAPIRGTIEGVAGIIQSDAKLKALTESYRKTGDKEFKRRAPLFAVACLFENGKGRENITRLTGCSLVDFDHVFPTDNTDGTDINQALRKMKAKITADPHTLLCYITMSGNGLRVIYKYELPESHTDAMDNIVSHYQQAFFAGNAYYGQLIGCETDGQCKNITRLSGLAYDPEVYFNPDAVPFTAKEIALHTASSAKESKEQRQQKRIEEYYHHIIAPKLASDGIRFEPGSHNEYVMRTGYMMAQKRYNRKAAIEWATEKFAEYKDTGQVFKSCFDAYVRKQASDKKAGRDDDGGGKPPKYASVEEIKTFLDGHISLRFNEITMRAEYNSTVNSQQSTLSPWLPINDRMVNSLWSQMSSVARVNILDMYRVIDSDYVRPYHPFAEYLKNLCTSVKSGGEKDYIRELAGTVCVRGGTEAQERWYVYLKKWLVGMVAGWLSDGVVNNVVLVLIGEQGAYKTTWFSNLLPPGLRQYFYVKTNAHRMSRDDLLTLAQYGLVCCEELDTMRPAELNQLKAAVTMPSIDERAAYARYHEHRQHIASFCGTGNNLQFLSDTTGNRRWLPFEVESILSPRDHPFAYEGIYAQAYALYKSGFRYWFDRDEVEAQNAYNQLFETPHIERELVDLYFRIPLEGENGEFMTVARALQLISYGISQKLSSTNVSRAFTELGFKRVRTNRSRGHLVVCRTAEEMKAYQMSQALSAESDE